MIEIIVDEVALYERI